MEKLFPSEYKEFLINNKWAVQEMAIANKQKFFGSMEIKFENGNVSIMKIATTKVKPKKG